MDAGTAFCQWETHFLKRFLESKKRAQESDSACLRAEWEYAGSWWPFIIDVPWGNYYLKNKKGCLLANFKPGRGNYPEDGGFYTVRADAYWPNDSACIAWRVMWPMDLFPIYEGGYNSNMI